MTIEKISTKSNLWKRFFAGIIDYSIIILFTYLVFNIWGENDLNGKTIVKGLPAFCITLFWFIWTIGFEQCFGATLGNSIFNLKPISTRVNKLELTFGQSFKRHLLDILDLSPFGIGALLINGTNKNQRLGDIWAETVVVSTIDNSQYVKKFNIEKTNNIKNKKHNPLIYIAKRTSSALVDILVFAVIIKILEPILYTKENGEYFMNTFLFIALFYLFLLSQDLLFKKTLGKRFFNLEIKLLKDKNSQNKHKYIRIIFRRVFDLFEIICPFIYLISISVTEKKQKIGDKITNIIITER
jgi:uncharacterized RDD family membrane protein YckC